LRQFPTLLGKSQAGFSRFPLAVLQPKDALGVWQKALRLALHMLGGKELGGRSSSLLAYTPNCHSRLDRESRQENKQKTFFLFSVWILGSIPRMTIKELIFNYPNGFHNSYFYLWYLLGSKFFQHVLIGFHIG